MIQIQLTKKVGIWTQKWKWMFAMQIQIGLEENMIVQRIQKQMTKWERQIKYDLESRVMSGCIEN